MEKNTEIVHRMEDGKTHPSVCISMKLPPSIVSATIKILMKHNSMCDTCELQQR
jgi:hypothetical protein